MLTLTKAAFGTKLLLKAGGLIIGLTLILLLLFRGLVFIKNILYPPPPPSASAAFGKLPVLEFEKNATSQELVYSLNTLTGELPETPTIVKVFKIESPKADLLALEKAQGRVEQLNFIGSPSAVSKRVYRWSTTSPFLKTLSLDTVTGDIRLASNYLDNQFVLSANRLPTEGESAEIARTFLEIMEALPPDLEAEKPKITLLTIKNYVLFPATSFSSAHVVKIDFLHKDKDKLPVYYPRGKESTINVLIAGGENNYQIVEANYYYQKISDKNETYAIKTPEEAFQELKDQKAYIAAYFGTKTDIEIEKISLAYYQGEKKHPYLMPIFVFEGTNGFIAYVSAVKDEWIDK